MAYIAFENRSNLNAIKGGIMSRASGGEYVHCEIVLTGISHVRCSSWHPSGVQVRPFKEIDNRFWKKYDLGNCDNLVYQFFQKEKGKKYGLTGLIYNMMLNANINDNKTFCSQICYKALKSIPNYPLPDLIDSSLSPSDLEKVFAENNFRILT